VNWPGIPPAVQKVSDRAFIEATTSVLKGLCQAGNVVIIGRGANVILAGAPRIIHVGMLAPLEVRVATIMEREDLTREEAEAYIEEVEQARAKFFRKFFKVNPDNPSLYHLMLNLGQMRPELAAEIIAHTAKELGSRFPGVLLMEIIPLKLISGAGSLLVTLISTDNKRMSDTRETEL
jgi:cytidylate kinase